MDIIHSTSIHAISAIQQSFEDQKHWMFMLSNVFDPRYAFLFYSPLIFALDRCTGRKVMWVTVIAEWSNQILKWLMRGERPYWWVHEFKQSTPNQMTDLPQINQTFMTCETGPGSPSGHSMATAALWYIIIEAMLKRRQNNGAQKKTPLFNSVCWSIYTFVLCCVSLSRIYLAAHFPHQCLLGMVMGVAVAMMVSSVDTESVSRRAYIMGTVALFASAMTTYALLLAVGFNPLWSVERALKWCANRDHVHLDTTPFFSMMRYIGFFLGMGLGLHSRFYLAVSNVTFKTSHKITAVAMSLAVSKAIELMPVPKELNVNIVYAIAFLQAFVLPYIFIGVVPYLVAKVHGLKTVQSTKVRRMDSNNNHIKTVKSQ